MSEHFSKTGARLLFDPALVPSSIDGTLPANVVARPLARDDHAHGHVELLSTLTSAPTLTPEVYEARFDDLLACPSTYFVIVFEDTANQGKIVASASLVVERKFLRNAGIVGHVEDVVVHPDYKGNSMGKIMLNALKDLGLSQGCYKIILDCDPKNVGFYEKCGFANCGIEMSFYRDKKA